MFFGIERLPHIYDAFGRKLIRGLFDKLASSSNLTAAWIAPQARSINNNQSKRWKMGRFKKRNTVYKFIGCFDGKFNLVATEGISK